MHASHARLSLMRIAACFCDLNGLNHQKKIIGSAVDESQKWPRNTTPGNAEGFHMLPPSFAMARWAPAGYHSLAEAGPIAPQPYGDDGRDGPLGKRGCET